MEDLFLFLRLFNGIIIYGSRMGSHKKTHCFFNVGIFNYFEELSYLWFFFTIVHNVHGLVVSARSSRKITGPVKNCKGGGGGGAWLQLAGHD